MDIQEKECKICGQVKLLEEFLKDSRLADGHRNKCKECDKKQRKLKANTIHIEHKICNKCGKDKSIKEFRKSSYSKDGYASICSKCSDSTYSITCNVCGKEFTSHHKNTKCCANCFGETQKRERNYNWNPNLTEEQRNDTDHRLIEGYSEWREEVYKRDNYTCQCCGDNRSGKLNAHHLDGYNWCEEKRTDVDNGITLCEKCHKKFHKMFGRKNNTKEQFKSFINKLKTTLHISN